MLPELAPHLNGMARGDSVSFDAHKWLGVPYEAGCLMVRDVVALRRAFAEELAQHPPRQRLLDAGTRPAERGFGHILKRHVEARLRKHLRDAGTHRAGADDADVSNQP